MQSTKLKDDRTTCHGLHLAVVADKLDFYLAKRRLEKEKCSFYFVLDIFLVSQHFLASCMFLRGTLSHDVSRIPTDPGKPGKSWNFIIAFSRSGLESPGKRPLVLESSGNL